MGTWCQGYIRNGGGERRLCVVSGYEAVSGVVVRARKGMS